MAFDKETAARLESLYREHLEEVFHGNITFDPITVELTRNMFDQDAFHVTVAYDGDGRQLDPAKLNRISSVMVDEAAELGIENTLIESYVDTREYGGQVARTDEPLDQISGNQDWHDLLNLARRFLNTDNPPNETELSTGVDRCYFAMYHALCHNNADALAGRPQAQRREDWTKVYMGMDECSIAERFRQYRPQASNEVQDFGAAFAILQEHRDRAMERPSSTFFPSEVARLIQRADSAIVTLEALGQEERRSLAINLLVGKIRGKNPARIPTG